MKEFDLIEILNFLWKKKAFLLKTSIAFFVFGIFLYVVTPKEYEASTTLLSEVEENDLGGFSQLGAFSKLAGINVPVSPSTGSLPSSLYPDIVTSFPFLIDVYKDSVCLDSCKTRTSIESYFQENPFVTPMDHAKKYTLGLPGVIISLFKSREDTMISIPYPNNSKIELNRQQAKALNRFKKRISVSIDKTNGLISISVTMPDQQAAADLATIVKDQITRISTNYKIQKLKEDLNFIESRYVESKRKFYYWQRKVAEYRDSNNNIYSAIGNIDRNNIQDEYSLAYSIYQGLAKQREQKEIELKQETPVFTVLQPVMVPLKASSPTILLPFVLGMLGFFLASFFLIFKPILLRVVKD